MFFLVCKGSCMGQCSFPLVTIHVEDNNPQIASKWSFRIILCLSIHNLLISSYFIFECFNLVPWLLLLFFPLQPGREVAIAYKINVTLKYDATIDSITKMGL